MHEPSPFWDPFSLLLPHLPLQIHSPSSLPPGRLTPALPRNLDLWFCLGNLWPMGGPRGRAEDGQRLLRPGFEYFLHPWGSRCSSSRFSWAWQWKDSFVYSPTSVWLWLPFQGSIHHCIPLIPVLCSIRVKASWHPSWQFSLGPTTHFGFLCSIFLAVSHIWDLGSLTKDQTLTLCMGSTESQPLGHQGSPLVPLQNQQEAKEQAWERGARPREPRPWISGAVWPGCQTWLAAHCPSLSSVPSWLCLLAPKTKVQLGAFGLTAQILPVCWSPGDGEQEMSLWGFRMRK